MPTLDAEAVRAFWEHAGFVALEVPDDPLAQLALTSDALTLTLHPPRAIAGAGAGVRRPADAGAPRRSRRHSGLVGSAELPAGLDRRANALLEAPEGTLLLLLHTEA